MGFFDCFVEAGSLLVNLSANTAYKPVAKSRHTAKKDHRTILNLTIRLRQGAQSDIALLDDGLVSEEVYSGSDSE